MQLYNKPSSKWVWLGLRSGLVQFRGEQKKTLYCEWSKKTLSISRSWGNTLSKGWQLLKSMTCDLKWATISSFTPCEGAILFGVCMCYLCYRYVRAALCSLHLQKQISGQTPHMKKGSMWSETGSGYHQRLPDGQMDGASRDRLQEVHSLGQGELVHRGLVDWHQLVSRKQTAMTLRWTARNQWPDHHHTSTSVHRVLVRYHTSCCHPDFKLLQLIFAAMFYTSALQVGRGIHLHLEGSV